MNPAFPNGPGPRPRGALPDAETADAVYLIKNVSVLRATYQIRLLAYLAAGRGKRLVLKVPRSCRFDPALAAAADAPASPIRREDLA